MTTSLSILATFAGKFEVLGLFVSTAFFNDFTWLFGVFSMNSTSKTIANDSFYEKLGGQVSNFAIFFWGGGVLKVKFIKITT